MNKIIRIIGIVIVIALIVTVANGFYVLEEGKQAVITQFGRPVGQPVTEAGLHFKTPYVQEATYFEKKILIWDGDPTQDISLILEEQNLKMVMKDGKVYKNLLVDPTHESFRAAFERTVRPDLVHSFNANDR